MKRKTENLRCLGTSPNSLKKNCFMDANVAFVKVVLLVVAVLIGLAIGGKVSFGATNGNYYIYKDNDISYSYQLDNQNAVNVTIMANQSSISTANQTIKIPSEFKSGNNKYTVTSLGRGDGCIIKNGSDIKWQFSSSGLDSRKCPTYVIPDTVKTIKAGAFERMIVSSENFDKLETIEDRAFCTCIIVNGNDDGSKKIKLTALKSLGNKAFSSYSGNVEGTLTQSGVLGNFQGYNEIEFGSQLTKIGDEAFYGNRVLDKIIIPGNITEIGAKAFKNCRGVDELKIEGVRDQENKKLTIGDYAFEGIGITAVEIKKEYKLGTGVFALSEIKTATIDNEITELKDQTFAGSALETIKFKNLNVNGSESDECPLTKIGKEALAGTQINTQLYNKIMKKVTEVGDGAFSSCSQLNGEIEISTNVTTFGESVFKDCGNIETGKIKASDITELPASTYENCDKLKIVEIPESVIQIGDSAFKDCESLDMEQLNGILGQHVTEIGNASFEECTGIKGPLTLPNSVTKIGDEAFKSDTGITGDLTIEKVTEIGNEAFYGCTGLDGTITLEGDLTKIGREAFRNCENAERVELGGEIDNIGEFAFYNTAEGQKVVDIDAEVQTAGTRILTNPEEIFIQSTEEELEGDFRWFGIGNPIIHYGDCTHPVEVVCYVPGVTVTKVDEEAVGAEEQESSDNTLNNKTTKVQCKSKFKFKVDSGEYKDNLVIKLISEGEHPDSELDVKTITLEADGTYTIDEVKRAQKIIIQTQEDGTNLVLKSYISYVNNTIIGENRTREPKVSVSNKTKIPTITYKADKEQPLELEEEDIVTYTIRVYNEGKDEGEANEITVRVPERVTLVEGNSTNELYGWKEEGKEENNDAEEEKPDENQSDEWQSLEETAKQENTEQGNKAQDTEGQAGNGSTEETEEGKPTGKGVRVFKTTKLQGKKIEGFNGTGKPQYQEVEIVCKVPSSMENDECLVLLAEISKGNDNNAIPNNADKIDTSKVTSSNCTLDVEDDTDYDVIKLAGQAEVGYDLVVKKIDANDKCLLNGAKIRLYDKDKKVIKDVITQNGEANFGSFCTYGEGRDVYYIEEVETPMGYKRTIDGMIELQVIKEKETTGETKESNGNGQMKVTIICDVDEINSVVEGNENLEYIPIRTKDELKALSAKQTKEGEDTSKEVNYQLQNDIDLNNEEWTPINMKGTFDGNNHKISNLKLTNSSDEPVKQGLFGEYEGVIKNLTLENVSIGDTTASTTGSTTTKASKAASSPKPKEPAVGALVGCMKDGTVLNCKVDFTIYDKTLAQEKIGGIIGKTDSKGTVTVKKSSAKVTVKTAPSTSNSQESKPQAVAATSSNFDKKNVGGIIGYVGGNANLIECSNEGSNFELELKTGIGGFVGYSKEGGMVRFDNCVNTADIKAEENVGGLIGCARGSISIDNCENKGTIGTSGTTVSAGGLVGYAEPTKYAPKNINVSYKDSKITVYITNKETTDKYKLNILKVCKLKDAESAKRLAGAEFKVYKYKKNNEASKANDEEASNGKNETEEEISSKYELLKTEKTSNEGTITIDDLPITSLTNDVYYIKEVKAPEGYDILVKDYIKVQLKAKWDGVNERYVIDPEITLDEKISDEEIKQLESNKVEKEDNVPENSDEVKWKASNMTIYNSTNKGTVQGKHEIGGIVGLTKGYALIKNCHNKLNVEENVEDEEGKAEEETAGENSTETDSAETKATNKSAQAEATETDLAKTEATEEKPKNKIEATDTTSGSSLSSSTGQGNVGGIVGDAIPSSKEDLVEIINCRNETEVIGKNYNVGGIIGSSPVNVEITKCENKGSIKSENTSQSVNIGGILGASYTKAKIYDSTNTGNIELNNSSGYYATAAGGILGSATYTQIYKNNQKASPYGFDIENTYLEINNCKVKNSSWKSTSNSGGIVGQSEALENIITDCMVEKCTVEGSKTTGSTGRSYGNIYRRGIHSNRK